MWEKVLSNGGPSRVRRRGFELNLLKKKRLCRFRVGDEPGEPACGQEGGGRSDAAGGDGDGLCN